jgi:Zn-dependent protease with chaperone function
MAGMGRSFLPFLLLAVSGFAAPASEVKSYTLPPDKLAKAVEYARARNWLHFAGFGWEVAALAGVLALHVAPRFRAWAERASRRRIAQAYIFGTLLLATIDLANLPLAAYGHRLALAYQQSIEHWGPWLWDWAKAELLVLAVAGPVLWILYGIIRRSPRRWCFYFWLAAVPMVVFLFFVQPVILEPLFFRFEPLAAHHADLAGPIERVTERGGLRIPPERMFVMNASTRWTGPNAYVTGIGASERVVVWDTCFAKLNTDQVLVVFGHEMGHYVLGHLWIGMGSTLAGLLVSLFVAYHAMRWALARWGNAWSIGGMADWASLAVLLLAAAILGFLGEPIENGISRVMEHNADVYGLEVIHGLVPNAAQVAAEDFQIEGEAWLADPHPSAFIEFWLYDHPPVSERLAFAATYDPWDKGERPRYVGR